jgi:DNA-directed RNA polymerase II subunit RPB3
MISLTNFIKSAPDTIKFDIENCNSSFANAIRRTIITDVETLSFNTDDYVNSDLKVITNTSSLHNEFILHRMGLLPIYTDNLENYNPDNYKFILKKSNNTSNMIDVTTNDIEVLNLETNKFEDSDNFFPKNPITDDYILIIRLKSNPNGEGQSIHIEGKSSKGSGKQHIRFSPVSTVIFTNKINPELLDIEFNKYISELQIEKNTTFNKDEIKKLANKFNIEQSERCFYTDKNNDPNIFEFTIETVGVLQPHRILISSMKCLSDRLKSVILELEKELSNKPSSIKVKESECVMKSYDIIIDGESHTIGHLLQSYINKNYSEQNLFVGYMNPHPLQNEIFLRIKSDDINQIKDIITSTCNNLIETLSSLRELVLKNFEGKVIMKKSKKVKE